MTHTYKVSGMTCTGCQSKVQGLLSKVTDVKSIAIDLPKGIATIEMDKHIATSTLKEALKDYPKYQLSDTVPVPVPDTPIVEEAATKSWLATYKPILLIFGYITTLSLVVSFPPGGAGGYMQAMRVFMAGFFLIFSFFKMLDLKGFAESYAMYDIVAKKWNGWGYVYAFIELGLGISFAINFQPLATNIITVVVMAISSIGVLQSVVNKRTIKCACLGTVFNLPMSTVTIIEDTLMIGMGATMIILL
ncbi:MAG: cation transporter [Bacteroidota bacterium]|nr:cation transporter [Bacteroidota bacterium]